jgi:hypothetical protein
VSGKFTPGPWIVREPARTDEGGYIDAPNAETHHKLVAWVYGTPADARLSAASLEMYEALKAQEAYIEHVGECNACDVEILCETAQMLREVATDLRRAALSKAEGRE